MANQRHRILRVTGGKVAWTNTSRETDKHVCEAIRFVAREVDLNRVVVHVKKCGYGNYGMAYEGIPTIANLDGLKPWEWSYLITVKDAHFLHTLAHEAKHIEQYREGLRRSEIACDAFAAGIEALWEARKVA